MSFLDTRVRRAAPELLKTSHEALTNAHELSMNGRMNTLLSNQHLKCHSSLSELQQSLRLAVATTAAEATTATSTCRLRADSLASAVSAVQHPHACASYKDNSIVWHRYMQCQSQPMRNSRKKSYIGAKFLDDIPLSTDRLPVIMSCQ